MEPTKHHGKLTIQRECSSLPPCDQLEQCSQSVVRRRRCQQSAIQECTPPQHSSPLLASSSDRWSPISKTGLRARNQTGFYLPTYPPHHHRFCRMSSVSTEVGDASSDGAEEPSTALALIPLGLSEIQVGSACQVLGAQG